MGRIRQGEPPTCDDHGVGVLMERWGVSLLQDRGCELFFIIKAGERERGEGERGWFRPGWTGLVVAPGKLWPRIYMAKPCRDAHLQSEGADLLPSHRLLPGEGLGSFRTTPKKG